MKLSAEELAQALEIADMWIKNDAPHSAVPLSKAFRRLEADYREALQAAGRMRALLQKTYDADFFKHLDECNVQFHKGSPPTGCTCGISEIANEIRAALKQEGREP